MGGSAAAVMHGLSGPAVALVDHEFDAEVSRKQLSGPTFSKQKKGVSHIHQNDQWPSARCSHRSGPRPLRTPSATRLLGASPPPEIAFVGMGPGQVHDVAEAGKHLRRTRRPREAALIRTRG
ncbi:unnamed protein product [Rangifer tarandus platyrhynchus]|uniref:Uncharacterized protein n=1 Tax=Rangifer tarandus platyrhynchus TaxID=3082113 RepID=A0AC60A4W6_RANTA